MAQAPRLVDKHGLQGARVPYSPPNKMFRGIGFNGKTFLHQFSIMMKDNPGSIFIHY